MIHIGMLDQTEISSLLQSMKIHQKTGRLIVTQENARKEIYLSQGYVILILTERTSRPLVYRLLRSEVVTQNDLQRVPIPFSYIFTQSEGTEQYTDVQVAKILLKIGILGQEQLSSWVKKEISEELQQLLKSTIDVTDF